MEAFTFTTAPSRVVFGPGARCQVAAEVERLGRGRALVVCTPGQAGLGQEIADRLGQLTVGCFAQARLHTPVAISDQAAERARVLAADVIVAVGGGSAVGLSKAVALRTGLDQVVMPTTYAGSEMTGVIGQTEGGVKTTRQTPDVLPEAVIYDVELTLGLPAGVSVSSGLNAIAHAVEALYARDANPVHSLLAEEAIRLLATSLPAILADPRDVAARSQALNGAWLASSCIASVGVALHHKLCHVIGGAFGLPHAETHAVILPYAMAYNADYAPGAMRRVARSLGVDDAVIGMQSLARRLGAPNALRDLGMPEDGIGRAADLAVTAAYPNPRPIDRASMQALIAQAWVGEPVRSTTSSDQRADRSSTR